MLVPVIDVRTGLSETPVVEETATVAATNKQTSSGKNSNDGQKKSQGKNKGAGSESKKATSKRVKLPAPDVETLRRLAIPGLVVLWLDTETLSAPPSASFAQSLVQSRIAVGPFDLSNAEAARGWLNAGACYALFNRKCQSIRRTSRRASAGLAPRGASRCGRGDGRALCHAGRAGCEIGQWVPRVRDGGRGRRGQRRAHRARAATCLCKRRRAARR
eukprot:4285093-Pleurochrysis_carterae.AAC.1